MSDISNKEPNKDYMNKSLLNQIRNLSYIIAEREAMVEELGRENIDLIEKVKGLEEELSAYKGNDD